MDFDSGALVGGILTAFVAWRGLRYTAQQIRLTRDEQNETQRWRRTRFGSELIDKLSTDDELAFCARALDWGVGPLVIPEKHRPIFEPPRIRFEHQWSILQNAMKANLDGEWGTPESLTYRYSFDAFFSYLETLKEHIAARNIDERQSKRLDYYLELIRKPIYAEGNFIRTQNDVFKEFVKAYYPALIDFIWKSV